MSAKGPSSRTRRELLAALSAVPVVSVVGCGKDEEKPPGGGGNEPPEPAPDRSPEPAPWQPEGTLDEAAFPWAVQSGDALPDGIVLSVQTDEPALALLVVGELEGVWEEVARQEGLVPADGALRVELGGLSPDRAHRFVFLTPDGRRSEVGRFRTALAEDGWRKIVFGATSCLGSANPGWANLGFVAEHELDFFLLLGDTLYADDERTLTLADYRTRWKIPLGTDSFRSACASTSVVAIWDDHEVANNWVVGEGSSLRQGVTPERLADATRAFREVIPQRTVEGGPMWRSLRWGSVLELIVLDPRGERAQDKLVSDEQLAWAIDRIKSSPAKFKIVLTSIHVTDHTALMATVQAEDRWQGYPAQREALLDACEQAQGSLGGGVLFVTGDMHYGAIQRVSPEGAAGEALWEVAAGPSGSSLFAVNALAEFKGGLAPQYEDILEEWSWARFEVDPGLGTVHIQLIGDDGLPRVERVLEL